MYSFKYTNQFKRDFKKAIKRGFLSKDLEEVLTLLHEKGELPKKFRPHRLKGKYQGLWECHIRPDWLLIWDQEDDIRLISLVRTGSHSDLF